MAISKDEFLSWMHDPVTEVMREQVLKLAARAKIELAGTCGYEPRDDLLKRGIIKGMEDSWDLDALLQELFQDESDSEGVAASY